MIHACMLSDLDHDAIGIDIGLFRILGQIGCMKASMYGNMIYFGSVKCQVGISGNNPCTILKRPIDLRQ